MYEAQVNILAPLSGYTDLPFRLACRRQGCVHAFAPLLDAGSLIHGNRRNRTLLVRGPDEPWLGAQVLGASPAVLTAAAARLRDLPFDVLDLNLGCPVPKVTRRGAGAALLPDSDRAARCAAALVTASRQPVTAKIRILTAADPEPTVRLGLLLQECGVRALTVHGRTTEQIYSGPVAGAVIDAVRQALRIPVIANGGVFDRQSAALLRAQSGCSRVMIARGAIGNPWIFRALQDPDYKGPSHQELCTECRRHVAGVVELYGEEIGMRNARKIILSYLTGRGYRRSRRAAVTGVTTWREFDEFLAAVEAEGPSPRYLAEQAAAQGESVSGSVAGATAAIGSWRCRRT